MGAWSNEVEVTVQEEFDVASAYIAPDKSTVSPGETVAFNGYARFTAPAPGSGCVYADIYVNGSKQRSGVLVGSYSEGARSANIGFSLVFEKPGKYTVQAYVYTGPCGIRGSGAML